MRKIIAKIFSVQNLQHFNYIKKSKNSYIYDCSAEIQQVGVLKSK